MILLTNLSLNIYIVEKVYSSYIVMQNNVMTLILVKYELHTGREDF